jgi:two-component system cell cycle sensor histidine kinase/response regulator CckA
MCEPEQTMDSNNPSRDELQQRVEELTAREAEQLRTEKLLRQELSLFKNTNDGVVVTDLQGRITDLNPAAEKNTGYSRDEVLGKPPPQAFNWPGEDPEGLAARILETALKQGRWEGELRLRRKDGELRICEAVIVPLLGESGQPVGTVGVHNDITHRVRMEETLRRSEQIFQQLLENLQDVFWLRTAERFLYVSPSYERLWGKSCKSLYRHPSSHLEGIHPQDRERLLRDYHLRRFVSEEIFYETFRLVRPDGSERWVQTQSFPIKDGEGKVDRRAGIARDITELKRAEEGLRKSEEEYRLVVENANEAIVVAQDGMLKFFNPKALELVGCSREELAATPFAQIVHPEDRDMVIERHRNRFEDREFPETYCFRILDQRANTRWLEISVIPISWEGRPATLNFLTDVTERKQAEQELRIKENAIASSINGIAMMDLEGRLTYANSSFVSLWAYREPEEVLGRRAVEFWKNEAEAELVVRTLMEEGAWVGELEARRPDGSCFQAQVSASLVRDESGTPICGMASFIDISSKAELEQQLRQSRKMEAVGRLAGGVAHDFNNILTVIKGFSELLASSIDCKDPRQQQVEEIRKASDKGASLVRQLLAFSRRQTLQPQLTNLNNLVENMTKLLRRLIGEDIVLETRLDPALGLIRVDAGQIEQVIINLSVNAADSMPKGGTLTIETANSTLPVESAPAAIRAPGFSASASSTGACAMLIVSDTGSGMDEETLSRIYDPFFTTKDPDRGTGLGLSTVYGIVEQSGATIQVESAPGKGTTFRIRFPWIHQNRSTVEAKKPQPEPVRGSETICLVEDELSVRGLLRHSLEVQGYSVLEAANGAEALDICRRHRGPIHLLVTDMVMPGLNGLELAETVGEKRPDTKVLFISGYPERARKIRTGFGRRVSFFPKPFTGQELAKRVRELLDGPQKTSAST